MMARYLCGLIFFFQAEDGIRDLVRSRGLGDVYKRQGQHRQAVFDIRRLLVDAIAQHAGEELPLAAGAGAVSYTHLTLPTSDLV
mgnify:CR=1 FL=1